MNERTKLRVGVVGAGSWGTALAKHMADWGHDVVLWSHRPEHAHEIEASRHNAKYLPNQILPGNLRATGVIAEAVGDAEVVLSVVPSHTKRSVWTDAKKYLPAGVPV